MDSHDTHSATAGSNGATDGQGAPALRRSSSEFERDHPASNGSGRAPRQRRRQNGTRRRWTWTQRLGGALIATMSVFSALWYVPRVTRSDRRLLTGTVTSNGVVTLNFTLPGQIKSVKVRLGQAVRKGQVLATEDARNTDALIAGDKAAIAYDRAKIAQLQAAEAASPTVSAVDETRVSASKARLALDEAHLAVDRIKRTSTEVIAPSSGTVVAANGQPGETVTPSGVRNYAADGQQSLPAQQPEFSLLPEGPQSAPRTPPSARYLPVIALRTSATWQVVALIPEKSVSNIAAGNEVTIDVPAAHVTGVRGRIEAVLPTPLQTSTGTAYQANVTTTGHTSNRPLNGMAANIQVGS